MSSIEAPPITPGESFSTEYVFRPRDVIAFALAAGDTNRLHHDVEFARSTRFRRLIVSGTQTAALMFALPASHFSNRSSVLGVSFTIRFGRPVPADESVSIHWTVQSVEPASGKRGGQFLDLQGRMLLGCGTVCASATGRVLVDSDVTA